MFANLQRLTYLQENLDRPVGYPPDIRKAIYAINTVELLNSIILVDTKKRRVFPADDSVRRGITGGTGSIENMDYVALGLSAGERAFYYRAQVTACAIT
ncbi:hypothetical protein O0544_10610 [Edwardsiella anguillarum]|nr:hypothetical protein [Edwardsiella anguillarum]